MESFGELRRRHRGGPPAARGMLYLSDQTCRTRDWMTRLAPLGICRLCSAAGPTKKKKKSLKRIHGWVELRVLCVPGSDVRLAPADAVPAGARRVSAALRTSLDQSRRVAITERLSGCQMAARRGDPRVRATAASKCLTDTMQTQIHL